MARSLEHELNIARAIAREAAEPILRIYASAFEVEYKSKNDPVTLADREANALIVRRLAQEFPNDAIVAEESDLSGCHWVGKDRIWYIDPVDGTKEFLDRNGQFSVQIGLAIEGQAAVGVVFQPTTGLLYSGISDQGAWLENQGKQQTLRVSQRDSLKDATLIHTRSHISEVLQAMKDALQVPSAIPYGSVGLKIGKITEKSADFYLETTRFSKAWDSCGPEAILRGAGGRFTDLRGHPFEYGGKELGNLHGIVGSNGLLHEKILKQIEPHRVRFGL